MIRYTSELEGSKILATDGNIGHVEDLYFEDSVWTVRYLVADTAPLFFGRKVLLSPFAVVAVSWDKGEVTIELTKQEIKDSPDFTEVMPVSREKEMALYQFHQWPPYWTGAAVWGLGADPSAAKDIMAGFDEMKQRKQYQDPEANEQASLRSAAEVAGYSISARDGDIGGVEDFAVDDETWTIRYLVVKTQKLFGGKAVVLGTDWIESVDWSTRSVQMDLTQEQIRNAPEYQEAAPIERHYEKQLAEHYGKRGYWA